ncbi:TIGR04222 domain-containing protein [Kibdelosporangium aridum]|uniref:TIGR04222 domain-containing protein n=1 Tax=Kibdelosporangium aridum TaxID=2030 RepID=A0A1W2FPZ1_KIBAR|nr:TIGR04222 domain-containing membrane protein [Kibdelosporangium aridum]SMD23726.1 TIGR04222 domain-containing protein [Kibdelosporangium aridum]
MEDTWGIPEPTFIGIYLLGFSIALLFAFAVRILTRSGAATTTAPIQALSAQELACLTGGPRRVVEAAVAQLVDTGQLRASRDGYLQLVGRSGGGDPVERTVVADVSRHGRRSISILTRRLAESDAVEEVVARLVGAGYLVDDELAKRRKVISLVPVVVVFSVGVVRWLEGAAGDRPVGWLTVLLICSGVIGYAMYRQAICPRTFEGANAVGRASVTAPAELVAAGGFTRHPDRMIRDALTGRRGVTSGGMSGCVPISCGTEGNCKG